MEGSVKRDTFTARIDKSVAGINADASGILVNLQKINRRLLPPSPTAKSDEAKPSAPQGWLEETLRGLGDVQTILAVLRSEVNELFDAVEAGQVKGEEVKT